MKNEKLTKEKFAIIIFFLDNILTMANSLIPYNLDEWRHRSYTTPDTFSWVSSNTFSPQVSYLYDFPSLHDRLNRIHVLASRASTPLHFFSFEPSLQFF